MAVFGSARTRTAPLREEPYYDYLERASAIAWVTGDANNLQQLHLQRNLDPLIPLVFWHVFATGSKTVRIVVLILGSCGGVGWDVNVHCDCNHIVRSLALPHIRHATLLHVLLRFHTHVMLRYMIFTCTSCYATWSSLALHATLDDLHLHFMLR